MAGTRVRPSLPGTNYDNEGKPIAHLGREVSEGDLKFAGTAFMILSGQAREELQAQIEKLASERVRA